MMNHAAWVSVAKQTIVLDARTVRVAPGGVATYTLELIKALPKLYPEVPFVLLRHPEREEPLSHADNVREIEVGDRPHNPWTYWRMGSWLNERFGPDCIFHAPYRILPKSTHCKTLMTAHDLMQVVCPELVFPNAFTRPFLSAYWSHTVKASLRRAGRVLSVSHYTKTDIAKCVPEAVDRTRVTPLGVSPEFQRLDPAVVLERTKHLVEEGQRFFLVLGGGYANKNHVAAIQAFARGFKDSDIKLLVVQRERTLPAEVQRTLDESGVAHRVQVTGRVSFQELIALYNRAHALVFPSRYEGFGLPVLEAMACGCPVVASDATSVPEVAGDAALLCDPNDPSSIAEQMQQMQNSELRDSLIAKGQRRALDFVWSDTATKTARAYREIAPWLPEPS